MNTPYIYPLKQGGDDAVLVDKNIEQNGTYRAANDNADGYRSVNVEVPSLGVLEAGAIIKKSKNLFNKEFADTTTDNSKVLYTDYIFLEAGTYCYSVNGGYFAVAVGQWFLRGKFYDLNKDPISNLPTDLNKQIYFTTGDTGGNWYLTFTVENDCYFKPSMYIATAGTSPARYNNALVVDYIQIEKSNAPTLYEEYYDEFKYPKVENPSVSNVIKTTKNLFDKDDVRSGTIYPTFTITSFDAAKTSKHPIIIENGKTYTLSYASPEAPAVITILDSSCMVNSNTVQYIATNGAVTFTATFDGYGFISANIIYNPIDGVMFEESAAKTAFEPHFKPDSNVLANTYIGKSLYVFGDSIMAASTIGIDGVGAQLRDKYKMILTNYAVDGKRIALYGGDEYTTIQYQIDNASSVVPDYIIWNGGTNDISYWDSIPHGTISEGFNATLDNTTFCGAFEKAIKSLLTKYPGARIIYCTTHVNKGRNLADQNECWELARQMCKKWGMAIADINFDSGLNSFLAQYENVYTDDGGTHPNTLGYKLFYLPVVEHQL